MKYLLKKEWRYAVRTGATPAILALLLMYINISVHGWFPEGFKTQLGILPLPTLMTWHTQRLTSILFVGLLAIAVFLFYNLKTSGILLLASTNSTWFWRVVLAKASVIFACGMLTTINVIAYDVWGLYTAGGMHPAVIANIARVWLVNLILPVIMAMTLGFCIVVVCKELPQIMLTLVICVFAFCGLFGPVLTGFAMQHPWVYKLIDLFAVYPVGYGWWPDSIYGYPAENYRLAIQLFWVMFPICLSYAVLKPRKSIGGRIKKGVLLAASAVLAVYIMLPNGVVRKAEDMYDSADCYPTKDQLALYTGKTGFLEHKEPGFTVTEYCLNIKITSMLNATAQIKVADTDKTMYFTLYYGYKVKSVQDQNGEDLVHAQRGDALTVYGTQNVTEITIKYCGYSNYFYGNDQAMYLSGRFAYYPTPGRQGSMHNNQYSIYKQLGLAYDVPFTVKVDAPYRVYSSLPMVQESVFSGIGRYPTLLGGVIDQTTLSGLTLTQSPGRLSSDFPTIEAIVQALQQQCDMYHVTLPSDFAYHILQEPELMYQNQYYAKDHAVLQVATSPIHVAVGIMNNVFGDPNDATTKLLNEYLVKESTFASDYLNIDAVTEQETLYKEWANFALDNGIDFTMTYTIDYVVNHRGGGVMNYLNYMLQQMEVTAND